MGFGLWVLFDKESFIAVLRKCCNTHTHTHIWFPTPTFFSIHIKVNKRLVLLTHVSSAVLNTVKVGSLLVVT